jgi:hypothetical protein
MLRLEASNLTGPKRLELRRGDRLAHRLGVEALRALDGVGKDMDGRRRLGRLIGASYS